MSEAEAMILRTAVAIAEVRIADWKLGVRKGREWRPPDRYGVKSGFSHVLDLSNLGLRSVPESLREVHDLEILDLSLNKIRDLPTWIGEISALKVDLTGNNLASLPASLRVMPRLRSLSLQNNPALGVPESILATGRPQEILSFYFETRGQKGYPLLELKLLLVGRGNAGKTTLVKQLAGEEPNGIEPETHSISIREFVLDCFRGLVRTHAWDFGGQEILHSTHQFFLTERSLYLLVLEPRSGLAQRDAEYWLKLIETQGAGSPVIVVMNWSRGRHWKVDEVRLRRAFPFIVDFMSTDALHGEGIEALRNTIARTVEERMPDVWLPFPRRWRTIKDQIAGMGDNFLTYERYADLCARNGESDPERQANLAGILHALGLALYFGNNPLLHDTRVLNPGWVTGGVYAVIRSPSVAAADGQLMLAEMPAVLLEAEEQQVIAAADYPPETHAFILGLMCVFQLCFASEEDGDRGTPPKPVRYLVPDLLPAFEPEMAERWHEAPIRLRYTRYGVLLPGLLPRFIVRTHALSERAPHWRHGVVLRHGESLALIRAEFDQQELYVFVLGGDADTRRVLVTMVRRELDVLHREMKMEPVEELELTGAAERWFNVQTLREIEESLRPLTQMPGAHEFAATLDVSRELDKLEPADVRKISRDPAETPAPVRIFVSYARDDERQLRRLDAILDVLEQQHGLISWRDRRLIAGEEWNEEIQRRLEEMDIFLFIASQMSMVRPYIRNLELKRAWERREGGEVEIVTIKLEPCAVDDDPVLGALQRLAAQYGSIAEANPRSAGWEQVRRDLLPVIDRVRSKKARAAAVHAADSVQRSSAEATSPEA